jgi:hypothetical protein
MTDFGYWLISILFFNFVLPWFVVDLTFKPMSKVVGLISIFPIWLIKVAAVVAGIQLWVAADDGFWMAGFIAVLFLCLIVHLGARVDRFKNQPPTCIVANSGATRGDHLVLAPNRR